MINASGLTRTYGSNVAVDGLSFVVPRGVVCGFLGPNGAGKSSTIRMIAGLAPPDSGSLSVGGVDVHHDPGGVRRQVGYLPESNALYPELRVEEYLAFRGRLHGLRGAALGEGIQRALSSCGLLEDRRRLIGTLSRGFRQRTGLAAALVPDPPLLVLDEPTVGLDPVQQVAFRELLRRMAGDRTVLLSSHLLPEVEATCSWLVMISAGRLVACGPKEEVLHGEGRLVIAELDARFAPDLLDACRLEDRFAEVRMEPGRGPVRTLQVTPAPGVRDAQPRLGRLAAERSIPLRALGSRDVTLESIFLRASTDDPGWNGPGRPVPDGTDAADGDQR